MKPVSVKWDEKQAVSILADAIQNHLKTPPVVVCVGTDRSTGDSFGPLVGSGLQGLGLPMLGTLEKPVHAANLADCLAEIERSYAGMPILAVDSFLGHADRVGSLLVGRGPIKPGSAVGKILPPVGDVHLCGIVNVRGFMEYFVLQNTRLSLVMSMARVAAEAVALALCSDYAMVAASKEAVVGGE